MSIKYRFDAKKMKDEIVQDIRNWFDVNGKDCNAVIGLSGGKDSTITAALCVEALGAERVIGIMMPDGKQTDIEDAEEVKEILGIKFGNINIEDICREFLKVVAFNKTLEQAMINLPPRVRSAMLYFIAQNLNGRVINTSNLSEDYLGYFTRWGSDTGDYAPLKNLTVTEVIEIGKLFENIPTELIIKTPADGLCGKTDEERFGFSYSVLDTYIRTGVCKNKDTKAKIDKMHKDNLFKMNGIASYNPHIEAIG